MAIYVIFAQEQRYGGLHGIEDWDLVECSEEKEAEEIAQQMSLDVIESYNTIDFNEFLTNNFDVYDIDELGPDLEDEAWDGFAEECNSSTDFSIHELNDEAPSFEELHKEWNNTSYSCSKDFLQELCQKYGVDKYTEDVW